MTYTVHDYESRELFDRGEPHPPSHFPDKGTADTYAKHMQSNYYWVRVYLDDEYQYHLTPKGESDEP